MRVRERGGGAQDEMRPKRQKETKLSRQPHG